MIPSPYLGSPELSLKGTGATPSLPEGGPYEAFWGRGVDFEKLAWRSFFEKKVTNYR